MLKIGSCWVKTVGILLNIVHIQVLVCENITLLFTCKQKKALVYHVMLIPEVFVYITLCCYDIKCHIVVVYSTVKIDSCYRTILPGWRWKLNLFGYSLSNDTNWRQNFNALVLFFFQQSIRFSNCFIMLQ